MNKASPTVAALPLPRWKLQGREIVDRWTGKRHNIKPGTMVALLNRRDDHTLAQAEDHLDERFGHPAELLEKLRDLRDQLRDLRDQLRSRERLILKERERSHDNAAQAGELKDEVARLTAEGAPGLARLEQRIREAQADVEAAPFWKRRAVARRALAKLAADVEQLEDNPFDDAPGEGGRHG